ncbi:NAD/NADP octopine/nopaline dehydrogenase family protein [Meridianimarinicoccus sp. MJW13]|uniref:NAD/NADP octopine/nopaline dehydrogenase family protein n=1 Tax=Meridianimarinicoccus sp. MJW13 TaxID=2720031 RepID=UPI001865ADB9|nr:NAD/NADP octopine/nopaline dehydrogenase family protein [Fluviibacterium sp. MJW13]
MSLSVGIAGAGSIALATAALLESRGHRAVLWSPSGAGTKGLDGGITASGALEGHYRPSVADTPDELAATDVLLVAVPGYGHKMVFDALAPVIREGQHVIISSHASFGALYLRGKLAARGVTAPITCWGTTAVTGRRQDGAAVLVNTIRARIDMCTVPADQQSAALDQCETLFGPVFAPRDGLLAITLSNLNPQNHMGIALGNMTRMERGESWSQGQNVTPKVGRLLEQLDEERLAIATALELSVKTIFEHFHQSFHVAVASISEMNQQMHAQGNGGTGPATADSRYVTEDVPYGLLPVVVLGRLAGKPAVLHQAGIDIFSAMYGRDFATENELLSALDLTAFSLDDLTTAAHTGILPDATQTTPSA